MNKYKFYTNRRTGGHPCIDLGYDNDGNWLTIDLTTSPKGYGYFSKNPYSKEKDKNKISFYRKYISKNNMKHKGEFLRNYSLSDEDEKKIDELIIKLKYKKR